MQHNKQIQLAPSFNKSRIISRIASRVMNDRQIALSELIANSWDAGATKINIEWPSKNGTQFSISDNGIGMSDDDIRQKFIVVCYEKSEDKFINESIDGIHIQRKSFGHRGIGKFAIFSFGNEAIIETKRINTQTTSYKISKTFDNDFFSIESIQPKDTYIQEHGTRISCTVEKNTYSLGEIREYIGSKFIYKNNFDIYVNGEKISPKFILNNNKNTRSVIVDGEEIKIYFFKKQDKKAVKINGSGIAWIVCGRSVGDFGWKIEPFGRIFDGRTEDARKFLFVVEANSLENSVNEDWTKFDYNDEKYQIIAKAVYDEINKIVLENIKNNKDKIIKSVESKTSILLENKTTFFRNKVRKYIRDVVEKCPSISEEDIENLIKILCTLEKSVNKYTILEEMAKLGSTQFDKLNIILRDWTVDMATIVLDEIKEKLTLIDSLKKQISNDKTFEVQELQPLMEKCLWMLGTEFESSEYTSNETIASCFAKYMKKKKVEVSFSKYRPDFTIIPDSAVSFYYEPSYDEEYEVNGIENLVILELKSPRVKIGREEKEQPLRYYDEFKKAGMITNSTKVTAFVLGTQTENIDILKTYQEGNYRCHVMLFQTLLNRAEKRMFNLRTRIINAPFFKYNNKEE